MALLKNGLEALVTVGCDENGNNGTALPDPAPDGYNAMTATVVETEENVKGQIIGSIICNGVGKVQLKWNFLSVDEWATICKLFDEDYGGNFFQYVKFFDQTCGRYQVREMYPSDRKAGAFMRDPITGTLRGWKDCSLNLIDTRKRTT